MFQIKICGVRLNSDIDAAAGAGADAIGLNFFAQSIRFVDPTDEATRELAAHARQLQIMPIGVFVNLPGDAVSRIAEELSLAAVQLHGDEPTTVAGELIERGWKVIRAIKLPIQGLEPGLIDRRCEPWRELGCHLLLDAEAGTAHGGSGKCLDWSVVRRWADRRQAEAWTLAGGLDVQNVAEAIRLSTARSVDTASGVEQPRGQKSPQQIESFVSAALEAFAEQGQ